MNKYLPFLYIILGVLIGFFVFHNEPQIKSTILYDTVYVPQKPQIIQKKASLTKVNLNNSSQITDTTILSFIAKDSLLSKDSTIVRDVSKDSIFIASDSVTFEQGKLETKYYFPPINTFKYVWKPFPTQIQIQKETIVATLPWYKSPELWGVGGVIVGATTVILLVNLLSK